jgi:hypothetical protein
MGVGPKATTNFAATALQSLHVGQQKWHGLRGVFPAMSRQFKTSDEVAVLPPNKSLPEDVVCIRRVLHAGHCLIQTDDGKRYSANEGIDLSGNGRRIVPATGEHRSALESKGFWLRLPPATFDRFCKWLSAAGFCRSR